MTLPSFGEISSAWWRWVREEPTLHGARESAAWSNAREFRYAGQLWTVSIEGRSTGYRLTLTFTDADGSCVKELPRSRRRVLKPRSKTQSGDAPLRAF